MKKYLITFLVLAGCIIGASTLHAALTLKRGSLCVGACRLPSAVYCPTGYAYGGQIFITNASSTQTNYPMEVSFNDGTPSSTPNLGLKNTLYGGAVQSGTGLDIVFASSTSVTTILPFERELYSSTTGQLIAWVQVPTASSTNSTVNMCYGKVNDTDHSNATGVWDSNYALVYHMNDNAATTNVVDSTNQLNGTNQANTNTKTAAGKIDGALNFNGTSDFVQASASKAPPDILTWEAWYSPTNAYSICRSGLGASIIRFAINDAVVQKFRLYRAWTTGSSWLSTNSMPEATNTPTSFAVTYDDTSTSNAPLLYANGTNQPVATNVPTGSPTNTAGVWQIAAASGGNFCNGVFDEVRISTIVRSSSYLATTYNNEYSPSTFYTYTPLNTTNALIIKGN